MPVSRRFIAFATTVLVAFAVLGAFALPARADESVSLSEIAFNPASVTINVGEAVTWTHNDGEIPHTVTSTDGGPLDSGSMNDGDTYSFTFTEAGTYQYNCAFHPDVMTGSVTVQAVVEDDDNGVVDDDDPAPVTDEPAAPATGTGTTGSAGASTMSLVIVFALAVVLLGCGLVGFRFVRNR